MYQLVLYMSVNPTLKTIRMIEDTIKNYPHSIITVAELKRNLPRQVNHNIIIEVLEYLQENLKIYMSPKGITWTDSRSEELKKLIKESISYEELVKQANNQ